MDYVIVSDIDNTLFNFSNLIIKSLPDIKEHLKIKFGEKFGENIKFNDPFHFYDNFIEGNKEIVNATIKYLIRKSLQYRFSGTKIVEHLIETVNCIDVFLTTHRSQYTTHTENAKWVLENTINTSIANYINSTNIHTHLLLLSTDKRLDFIEHLNKEGYQCILIDDSPYTILKFFTRRLHRNNILIIPEWGYNKTYKHKLTNTYSNFQYIPHHYKLTYQIDNLTIFNKELEVVC